MTFSWSPPIVTLNHPGSSVLHMTPDLPKEARVP